MRSVRRILYDIGPRAYADRLARICSDHREIVRHEQVRHAEVVLKVLEQVHDLRLDRDVKSRDRLVADDDLRPQGHRARDADSLPLTARELARVAVVVLGIQPHPLHEVLHCRSNPTRRSDRLHLEGCPDDRADRVAGIERVIGILEDHLGLAPQGDELLRGHPGDVVAIEFDSAARRGDEP